MTDSHPFEIFGHRGARGHAPENTLRGLEAGIALGAQWLEFDVRLHPEGTLLLMHDARVDRTTGVHGRLDALSVDALRRLDAGEGEVIPTLEEALDRVGLRASVNIELKSFGATGAAVAAVLERRLARGWPASQFLVSSFHLPALAAFKRAAPAIPVAALVGGVPLDLAACASAVGACALHMDAEFVDPAMVEDAHRRGLKIRAFTVNEPDDMRALRAMGFDGVFTDYPERGLPLQGIRPDRVDRGSAGGGATRT
ncbi:MAG TPA: glycerophosphodiester phosphodiesterase family protein [Nevskiaceae bacterium]